MTIDEVRCPNCQKKVADMLEGKAWFTCPRCKIAFSVDLTSPPKRDMVDTE